MTKSLTEPAASIADPSHAPQHDEESSTFITGLSKTFTAKHRRVDALSDIDLTVRRGEYLVILGPSGCGKSTLLRCVAGLETPTSGAIDLAGKRVFSHQPPVNMKPEKRDVGMVFQSYALWPHLTVERNVAYPLKMRKVSGAERTQRAQEALRAVECEHLATRLPAELSGGQQQRIALARALVYQPEILLLDEPLSNLDALLRVSLRAELLRLHRELGFTALHITHDQEEALEMGDRVVLMRDGRIEQVGPPREVYARPVSPYAADFLGIRNRLTVRVRGGDVVSPNGQTIGSPALASSLPDGTELEMFVRGRDTHIRPAEHGENPNALRLSATLEQSTLGDGGRPQLIVDVDGRPWFVQGTQAEDAAPGGTMTLHIAVDDALFYRDGVLMSS